MKIAIIGCGKIANDEHIPAYIANEETEIAYFCFFVGEICGYVFVIGDFSAANYCYFHFLTSIFRPQFSTSIGGMAVGVFVNYSILIM